jgi:hypothetical protein
LNLFLEETSIFSIGKVFRHPEKIYISNKKLFEMFFNGNLCGCSRKLVIRETTLQQTAALPQ